MRIFLAGATGVVGRRLVPLLVRAGHKVVGTTRSAAKAAELQTSGVTPAMVDAFDVAALESAVIAARPEIVIHQWTDLPKIFDAAELAAYYPRNARIRTEGTRNLIAAARAASARRLIVQSIGFGYAPGREPHAESDPLHITGGPRVVSVRAVADMEAQVLASGMEAIVLRYGLFYGPGTWNDGPSRKPALHVDAAALAAFLAVTRGKPGLYNIADEDGSVVTERARRELGWDPGFRLAG